MDIDELRDPQILMYELTGADKVYTFYHDETNNVRKLHITDDGLNVAELKTFVLGGVAHEGEPRPIDIGPLRDAMRIQKTVREIKLEHVAKGDFLKVLESNKLTVFLQWLKSSELTVHYQELDPLYWSIIDIIDSILPHLGERRLLGYHALIKSDLAAILSNNLEITIDLFRRYNYPGLAPQSRRDFLNDLIDLVERDSDTLPHFNAMMLKGVLQFGRTLPSLNFIEGETPHLLIDNFSTFYLNRLAIFKYSTHILDMEELVREQFLQAPLTIEGKPATHYRFADSKSEPGIQIADIVVGMLGKMHSFLTSTPADEIAESSDSLTSTSLRNAELLRDLISTSHRTNRAFLNHVASVHDIEKLDMFLRFEDGTYAS